MVSARWYIGTDSAGVGFATGAGVLLEALAGVSDGVSDCVGVPPAAAASSLFGSPLQPATASTATPTTTTNERIPVTPRYDSFSF
ncbi:hypothetical protein GCM10010522_70780 [Kribbella solani]